MSISYEDADHPEIPTGLYCRNEEQGLCPHWQKTERGARCNLLGMEGIDRVSHFFLVWDEVKECGINLGLDEDDEEDTDQPMS